MLLHVWKLFPRLPTTVTAGYGHRRWFRAVTSDVLVDSRGLRRALVLLDINKPRRATSPLSERTTSLLHVPL